MNIKSNTVTFITISAILFGSLSVTACGEDKPVETKKETSIITDSAHSALNKANEVVKISEDREKVLVEATE